MLAPDSLTVAEKIPFYPFSPAKTRHKRSVSRDCGAVPWRGTNIVREQPLQLWAARIAVLDCVQIKNTCAAACLLSTTAICIRCANPGSMPSTEIGPRAERAAS